ncbi:MAG: mandelate racemase/muconate lactonizing enzyme family protein [Cyclobacteriaceae bacterium]
MKKTPRRNFLQAMTLTGGAAVYNPRLPQNLQAPSSKYDKLDEVLKQPVLRKDLLPYPVIIETLELLQDRNNFICRVRSREGAEGISIGHPFVSKSSYPMFTHNLYQHFINQDARELDRMVFNAVEQNVKRQGIPLCVQIATVEFAILDLLGNTVKKPAGELLGPRINDEVKIYLGTRLSELRNKPPKESLELGKQDLERTDAKAIKLRAGRGDNLGLDNENAPGRTEKLIKMSREIFGDDMNLMIDGNGSYSVKGAIRLGKMLQDYNFYFYEEPIPWDWYEEQKEVEQALTIQMAGGEVEFGMHAFCYLIGNEVFQIVQPDLFYFGGMIRSMKVARMAEVAGLEISPHISSGGLGYVYLLQMLSACPSAGEFHEFKMFDTYDANGTIIPVESKTAPFKSIDGVINVPTGDGMGITIDPGYIKTHKPIVV